MKKQHLTLTDADRTRLETMQSKGTHPVRILKRVTAWLALDRGVTYKAVATMLGVSHVTVRAWCDRYRQHGMAGLEDAPRPGRPPEIDGVQRATITAVACSDAPPGHAQWSLRLLADKLVEGGVCDAISHTHVGNILKKTT